MTTGWHRVVLAGGWISLMLIYLVGDALRIYAGHLDPGHIDGQPVPDWMWTMVALIKIVPIAMILTSLLTPAAPLRWITIGISVGLVILNLWSRSSACPTTSWAPGS